MRAAQKVRTFFAAFVGVLIARLVAVIHVISDTFAFVDGIFAEAGYAGLSTLAQWLGDRWPSVEKVMLGSGARPSYEPRYGK